MSTFTLDAIREAAEAKYGSLDIQVGEKTVRLLNPLRLPKAKREELAKFQDTLDAEGSDQAEVLRDVIRTVVDNKVAGEVLIKAVGDDLAVLAEIFTAYGSQTKLGEASDSHS